jgi:hypothetical protein
MLSNEYPCVCEHPKKLHSFQGDWMFHCAGIVRSNGSICECQVFRPDNLRFIELLGEGGLQEL